MPSPRLACPLFQRIAASEDIINGRSILSSSSFPPFQRQTFSPPFIFFLFIGRLPTPRKRDRPCRFLSLPSLSQGINVHSLLVPSPDSSILLWFPGNPPFWKPIYYLNPPVIESNSYRLWVNSPLPLYFSPFFLASSNPLAHVR